MTGYADTIVAAATAAGRSAVSIVRLSGVDAEQIARRCVAPWPERPRQLTRCVVHATDAPDYHIDEALVVVFPAPRSYTGETVVEIHGHGGTYVPDAVQSALVMAGARPAVPGEFTQRATRNSKIDLIRAEAIGELINARTRASHRSAMQALSGTLTRQYDGLRSATLDIEALIAYDIDFPDEDHGPLPQERVIAAVDSLTERIQSLLATQPAVILAEHGAVVVLAGPPNAGKSSLLNALVGEARVIVSDEPGTTRDAVEVLVDGDPWPIRLVDTAGLRNDAEQVERLGIAVSERYLGGADLVVACADTSPGVEAVIDRIRTLTEAPVIAVLTKSDLRNGAVDTTNPAWLSVSAMSGEGLSALQARIVEEVANFAGLPDILPTPVASARQRAALETALGELDLFRSAWVARELPAPVAATHLRAAVTALDHLIGVIDVDEIFSRVFSTFCVGK